MPKLEINDIQGIILRSYGSRRYAKFLFLEINDVQEARKWIGEIRHDITNGKFKSEEDRKNDAGEYYLNIAFSLNGLEKLGIKAVKDTHNPSFVAGPLNEHTLRMLGDTGDNAPENWYWGYGDTKRIHILLLVYSTHKEKLASYCQELENQYTASGISTLHSFDTHLNKDGKEHFGFVDGISQPVVEGSEGRHKGFPENTVKAGEFVLGYKNEYGRYAESPLVEPSNDPKNLLRDSPVDNKLKNLGMNGSYLVFRQLSEDVMKFWNYVKEFADSHPFGPASKGAEHVAAKMLGRWTNGSPITLFPDNPGPAEKQNKFFYWKDDLEGHKCPIGSHIRRANPRDEFEHNPAKSDDKNQENSLVFSKKHRIIRRARPYGKPVAESMDVKDILATSDDTEKRGIYFIVVNADYGRQFEFVQQTWIASPEFRELFSDPDPLMGSQANNEAGIDSYFTIQGSPVRQRIPKLDSFVTTKGSAYFFIPGIHVLQYIAEGF